MTLSPGTGLGHYEVLSLLGAGGMGQVYRARDTRLQRDVAIKVLPIDVARDAERLARFEREARLLASLNHPNIATLHGLEQSGEVRFLVMELVPGETLAELLRAGSLPVEETLGIFRQMADALEAAHDKGVVHRDLKPANVKVTPEGKVKVLDFGLAKALAGDPSEGDLSQSPTFSHAPTREGVILGTAPYMSPEQARGKTVGKQTDVWSFGCVFYEAFTGRKAFLGETVSDTIALVLGGEPDWQALPATTPRDIQSLLHRCLQKDLSHRLRDMGDARLEIEEALTKPSGPLAAPLRNGAPRAALWRRVLPWSIAAAGLSLAAGVFLWSLGRVSAPAPQSMTLFAVNLPASETLEATVLQTPVLDLSPDGTELVYVARHGPKTQLYLRGMNQLEPIPLAGTEGAMNPFFSPDGQWVAFFTLVELKKVSLGGGAPLTLCEVPPVTRGASWGPDGAIVFAPTFTSGLNRVPAGGGAVQTLTTPDSSKGEAGHQWPEVLPGGKAVVFTIWSGGSFDDANIAVLSLATGKYRILIEKGSHARYAPSGHLIFARSGGLLAMPFDLDRLEVTGSPTPVLDGVLMSAATGVAHFDLSSSGSRAYTPAGPAIGRRLVWVDRQGRARPLTESRRELWNPRLSPDGRRLAVEVLNDLWIYDIERDSLRRITFEGINQTPVWSPDGKRVAYSLAKTGDPRLFWRMADGSGPAGRLTSSELVEFPSSWSSDGRLLAYAATGGPSKDWDIWVLPLEGDRQPRAFTGAPFNEVQPMFSPDGRWLAYVSDESGRLEVYVQPYPGPGGKWQVSTEGGDEPVWAANGKELFYRLGDKLMATVVESEPEFAAGKPRLLFEGRFAHDVAAPGFASYGVTRDGQRFLMIHASEQESAPRQIRVAIHWLEELKRRVAAPSRH